MNKLYYTRFILSLVVPIVPLGCMDHRMVNFQTRDGIISVQKSNIPLIKTVSKYYRKYKAKTSDGGIVPLPKNVSKRELCLVNDALNVRPDMFDGYYKTLPQDDRDLLIKASGQYNYDGTKLMLNAPDVTRRLIEVYFDTGLRDYIKSYFKNEDEDAVRNYCREQLLLGKRLLRLKVPCMLASCDSLLQRKISLKSLFMDGYWDIPHDEFMWPIPLSIGDKVYKTYATHFIGDYEYRVTNTIGSTFSQPLFFPLSEQCLLWVINHHNQNTTSAAVTHTSNIKGCCFSKTGTGVEYIITYSDKDIVFSKITITEDGLSDIESIHVDIPENSTIVDAGFNHLSNQLVVGTYEGLSSSIQCWHLSGVVADVKTSFLFKKYGMLEHVFTVGDKLIFIYSAPDHRYRVWVCPMLGNDMVSDTVFKSIEAHNESPYSPSYRMVSIGESIFVYDLTSSPFEAARKAVQRKEQLSFFEKLKESFCTFEPDKECFRTYSPDGTFLLCNLLKVKLGILYVETQVKDAVTGKQITSIDTLYHNFVGVGFTHDSTELVFLNNTGFHDKVSLWDDGDKEMLREFEAVAFKNCAVTSLLKRLSQKCKKRGCVKLRADSSIRALLMNWWRMSSSMKNFLETCFPIQTIKS